MPLETATTNKKNITYKSKLDAGQVLLFFGHFQGKHLQKTTPVLQAINHAEVHHILSTINHVY